MPSMDEPDQSVTDQLQHGLLPSSLRAGEWVGGAVGGVSGLLSGEWSPPRCVTVRNDA